MNKTLIGIILLIGIIALTGCTEKTISCLEQDEIINNKISELNYCEKDEDCAYRGDNCPLYDRIMNKDADITQLEKKVEQYLEDCGEIACEQIAHFPLECQEGKCIEEKECSVNNDCAETDCSLVNCPTAFAVCENNECECTCGTCIGEGQKGNVITTQSECCSDLIQISNGVLTENGCAVTTEGSFYCTNCGNDICEEPENKCNCPKDCGVTIKAAPPERSGTDDFFHGEKVKIIATNNLDSSIWYPKEYSGCGGSFFNLQNKTEEGWVTTAYGPFIACEITNIDLLELESGEIVEVEIVTDGIWDEGMNEIKTGTYRTEFRYYTELVTGFAKTDLPEGGETVYSKEFEIVPKVTIKTDKKEYEKGETVYFETNHSTHILNQSFFSILKQEGDDWTRLTITCENTPPCSETPENCEDREFYGYPQVESDYCQEIIPSQAFHWNTKYCEIKEAECTWKNNTTETYPCFNGFQDAGFGTFKLEFKYFDNNICAGEITTIESNEFTILPNVTISTNKEEYHPNQSIDLTVKNNSTEKIWYWDWPLIGIEILAEEQWERANVYDACNCLEDYYCEAPGIVELEPSENIISNWNQKIDLDCQAVPANIGTYRAVFSYYHPYDREDLKSNTHKVYSDEFTITEWPPD